jgi:ribulose-phosphate 3-epimerase
MVSNPELHIDAFRSAGADAIGVHVEACPHLHRVLQQIKRTGARACVVLNPATPASAIEPVMPDVDQVLVMSVNPGFGGQGFIAEVLPKITEIRRYIRRSGRHVDLVVDGGIGPDTIIEVATAGANAFVMGSAFFQSGDYKRFVDEIRQRLAPYA